MLSLAAARTATTSLAPPRRTALQALVETPQFCACYPWCTVVAKYLRFVSGYWMSRGVVYLRELAGRGVGGGAGLARVLGQARSTSNDGSCSTAAARYTRVSRRRYHAPARRATRCHTRAPPTSAPSLQSPRRVALLFTRWVRHHRHSAQ